MFDFTPIHLSTTYAPATAEEIAAFSALGQDLAARCATAHPYLHASEDIFARLSAAYRDESAPLHESVASYIDRAQAITAKEAYALNDTGDALRTPIVNPYEDGFDVGGRLGVATHTGQMLPLAFAYRVTGDEAYARLAYLIGRDMIAWEHWCEGHFLNCADGAYPFAVAYDWLCGPWRTIGLDPTPLCIGLFERAIVPGYDSVIFDTCAHPSPRQGTGWRFKCKPDNWNAVCNGGLITACLSLLNDRAPLGEERYERLVTLLGGCMTSLSQEHLVLHQYVPDGSYVESNSYWAYGTNTLFRTLGALNSALGSDLGLHCAKGLDKTCYYAINTESAEYVGWNYHDGSLSAQDTSLFNVFATVSGDHALYALRAEHLARGKELTVYDLLYHPTVLGLSVPPLDAIPLDHYMEGIDGFTARSGFARGSLYTAILGGYNPEGGSHNQLDSGTFVYHNGGHMWLCDMGSDYYNTKHYFANYALYRRNAEGNNTLSIASLPFGQAFDATGHVERVSVNTDTPFVIIDNREVYAPYAETARRGMRVQDGRRVTVLRDELLFTEPQDAFWVAHFDNRHITAALDEDGRRCILTYDDGCQLSVRLFTSCDARIEVMDCYTFLLTGTERVENEYSRDDYSRLVIRLRGVKEAALSVVISLLQDETAYEELPTDRW
ncbi:MAG: heparinase II/III family protein [Clostridia bacterium]|nr:heparinase II/III family protein [Clostridia bacterium]